MTEQTSQPDPTGEESSALDLGSRVLLYMFVLGPIALLFVFLFFLGPLGWMVIATLVFAGMIFQAGRADDAGSTGKEVINCSDCGAPNGPDAAECTYCGETLGARQGA